LGNSRIVAALAGGPIRLGACLRLWRMAEELRLGAHDVRATDISSGCDFLAAEDVADV